MAQTSKKEIDHAFRYENKIMTDLGSLGGSASVARAINDRNEIVGLSLLPGDKEVHAFLYTDNTMVDLNTRITRGSGWTIAVASDINRSGQIAGTGVKGGTVHAVRLDPSSSGESAFKSGLFLLLSGAGAVFAFGKRRR